MKIGQKVAWKNRKGIQVGKIVSFKNGGFVGTTNKYPGLRPQRLAIVDINGDLIKIDRYYLNQKESGLTKEEYEKYTS